MPYQLEWEPKGVYWEYSGKVTGHEILEASTVIYGDPRFDDIRYKLVNFLNAESIDIEEDEVNLLAFQHKAAAISNKRVKTAIVINPGLTMTRKTAGMLGLFMSHLSDTSWEVKSFDSLEQANLWVGREE